MPTSHFPYGTFSLDPFVERQYQHAAPTLAHTFPLEPILPLHHPLLQNLEEICKVPDQPASWWSEHVASILQDDAEAPLQPLLECLSAAEFRQGHIEEQRWRAWKHQTSSNGTTLPARSAMLFHSPKIFPLVADSRWERHFRDRGPSQTPSLFDLIISSKPDHWLTMANSNQWYSCMRLKAGEEIPRLLGNFYDTGVAVAMLVPSGMSVWEDNAVIARTTLRVVQDTTTREWLVVVGQTYHNNATAAALLIRQVLERLRRHQLAWGWITGTNTTSLLREGWVGSAYCPQEERLSKVYGAPFWLPRQISFPYIDGRWHYWQPHIAEDKNEWYRLELEVGRCAC